MNRTFAALAVAATAFLSAESATAATLAGTFNVDIYNFNAGGSTATASATAANVTAQAANLIASITYTGVIDFVVDLPQSQSATTINEFLATGGGIIVGDTSGLDILLSTPSFAITTFFDFTAADLGSFRGNIRHDDGVTLLRDNVVIASSAPPTEAIDTPFTDASGDFRLIYAAANGNPSILQVTAVPLPAAALLLLGALGSLAFVSRRRRAV